MSNLVDLLLARKPADLSNEEYAAWLGLSQAFWSRLTTGRRSGRSYLLVCAAVTRFPDAWQEICQAIQADCDEQSADADTNAA